MMEDHEFCDSCEGCKPAILDTMTGKAVPSDNPMMIAVMDVWENETSYAERRAYIEVTLKNSRTEFDMNLCEEVTRKMRAALQRGYKNDT